MTLGAIKKEHLGQLVAAVGAHGGFYGPVLRDNDVCLDQVQPSDTLVLDYANFTLPPKGLFFPRSEVIATHGADGMVETPLPTGKAVLFGVRPCDAMSLTYLDKVFMEAQFADPYYRARRERTLTIALACRDPAATCFCTSVAGSPSGQGGADILAVDIGDALVLESATPAGEAFLAEYRKLLGRPSDNQVKARDAQVAQAVRKVSSIGSDGVTARLQASSESAAWEELAERCLGCGVCTFLCPTCHCFGLYDEEVGPQGRRVRAQDACVFPAFTLEASGHNPRTRQGLRMRHRVMHKFCYTAQSFGDIFCVGCGRCIVNCPANMDIRETLTEVPP